MMPLIALLLMGFLASVGSYYLKRSTEKGLSFKNLLLNRSFYFGGVLYVASALLNLYLLKKLPYSTVVSLGSLTYIWTLGIAHKFLGESITRQKLLGIVLILFGVALMTGTIQ